MSRKHTDQKMEALIAESDAWKQRLEVSCKAVKMESESRGDFPGDELGVCKVKKGDEFSEV